MLAHLKSKEASEQDTELPKTPAVEQPPKVEASASTASVSACSDTCDQDTRATCDVLCSLGEFSTCAPPCSSSPGADDRSAKTCAKQHQLPMFLSSECCNAWDPELIHSVHRQWASF